MAGYRSHSGGEFSAPAGTRDANTIRAAAIANFIASLSYTRGLEREKPDWADAETLLEKLRLPRWSRHFQLRVRRRYGFFTQTTHMRRPARIDWVAALLQFAKRPARAVVTPAACCRRESDHCRFHRRADSADGRNGEGRQKADAQGLAQRRAGRRLSLVRCRQ